MTVSPIVTGQFAMLRWRLILAARGLRPLLANVRGRTRTPTFQVLLAVGGMLGGAAVLGRVALGLMLIFGSLLVGVDGLLREAPAREPTLPDALERYRRAR
jgi:hypothetical protein